MTMNLKSLIQINALCIMASTVFHQAQAANLKPGLVGEYFKGRFKSIPATEKPFYVRVDKQVSFANSTGDFQGSKLGQNFTARWRGFLLVEKSGEYTFSTASDDGSRLLIDGKVVVDNWGDHSWGKKSGSTHLSFGTHPIEIQYDQGGGECGVIAYWMPPGGKETPIPASALFHNAEDANIAYDKKAWEKANSSKGKPGNNTVPGGAIPLHFGNFIGTAVQVRQDEFGENRAFRGTVIRLDKDGNTGILFDADTMRMAAGWTKPSIKFEGLPFTGSHGRFPILSGDVLFTNKALPGWAGSEGNLSDPREGDYPRLGPLPKAWAKYKGLYINGEKTLLRYTVGDAEVLEYPYLAGEEIDPVIIRHLEIKGQTTPLALVVADVPESEIKIDGNSAIVGGITFSVASNRKVKFVQEGTTLSVQIPAAEGLSKILVGYGQASAAPLFQREVDGTETLEPLTKGGPARWGDPIVTKGELGNEKGKPYVVDRITVPYGNPLEKQMRIGGFDFFSDGTSAAVSTWDGDVWIVKGIDEDLDEITWKRFATGQHETLGLKIVDDVVYTVADDQITRYHDLNGDGEADFYENFNNDWDLTSGFHAFCFDLHTDPKGNFYFGFGSPVRGGGRSFERMGRHHGSIIKVSKDGSSMSRYATGLRAPNGIGVGPDGQVTSGDNEGTFVPRSPINWMNKGSFHGVVDSAEGYLDMRTTPTVSQRKHDRPDHLDPSEMPKPLAWLPKHVDNSGGGQTWVTSDKWGPFQGELLHLSYGRSAIYLVLKEFVDGQVQGGVVPFNLRFTSSCMRARFNQRDGQLYVSGLKGWQTNAGKTGGLDRVRYTGEPVAMPSALNILEGKARISFTAELDKELAEDPESYSIKSSDIVWSQNYGSQDINPKSYEVKSAKLLGDKKTVELEIPSLGPTHQMEISLDLETTDGDEIVTKIWNTVHKLAKE
jgi:glucose/arabinose dehydrogenase